MSVILNQKTTYSQKNRILQILLRVFFPSITNKADYADLNPIEIVSKIEPYVKDKLPAIPTSELIDIMTPRRGKYNTKKILILMLAVDEKIKKFFQFGNNPFIEITKLCVDELLKARSGTMMMNLMR